MWLADPAGDIPGSGFWAFLGVLVLTAGSLGGIWLREKLRKPEQDVAPIAAQTAQDALEEWQEIVRESMIEPLQEELDKARRARIAAERAQTKAERATEALRANVVSCQERQAECQERLRRATEELEEKRREWDERPRPS